MDDWLCWGGPWPSDYTAKLYCWTARERYLWIAAPFVINVLIMYKYPKSLCNCLGVWDAEGGGGKTGAETAAIHGFEINTAFDLYTYLKQHHSQVTNSYHEALHQVYKCDFHYFFVGHSWLTILAGAHVFFALNKCVCLSLHKLFRVLSYWPFIY